MCAYSDRFFSSSGFCPIPRFTGRPVVVKEKRENFEAVQDDEFEGVYEGMLQGVRDMCQGECV